MQIVALPGTWQIQALFFFFFVNSWNFFLFVWNIFDLELVTQEPMDTKS